MIGSDDVLACFIAGNAFTWDDWFRLETEDDSLQPTIDMLLNVSVFMWYGAVCPWHKFVANNVIHIFRLVPLGIMVLLFRRLPMVLLYHKLKLIHQIEDIRRALFAGFFGPIGVSAIYYLYISREFLRDIEISGHERADAGRLGECIEIIVWFLVICSITVHGLSIPLGKLGFYLPRTISTAISTERTSASQSMATSQSRDRGDTLQDLGTRQALPSFRRRLTTSERGPPLASPASIAWIPRSFVRAGRHILNDIKGGHDSHADQLNNAKGNNSDSSGIELAGEYPQISGPTDPRPLGRTIASDPSAATHGDLDTTNMDGQDAIASQPQSASVSRTNTPISASNKPFRSITFADEQSRSRVSRIPAGEKSDVGESNE
jgi:hypothetical protein